MTDGFDGLNPTILIGWFLAALLFLLALWPQRIGQRGGSLALTGMASAVAVTLYSHDVMAMPQICAALIAGGAAGWLLARQAPLSALPAVLAGLIGQLGLAAIFIAVAGWRNPHAFGLLDDATDRLIPVAAWAMGAGGAFGGMACAGAIVLLARRTGQQIGRRGWPARILSLALPVLMIAAMAQFGRQPSGLLLAACIGLGLLTGGRLTLAMAVAGTGPALALLGGMAGWSAAALGFMMENMAMAAGGGLAGAAGTVVALRLCGGPGRKGLADGDRRP